MYRPKLEENFGHKYSILLKKINSHLQLHHLFINFRLLLKTNNIFITIEFLKKTMIKISFFNHLLSLSYHNFTYPKNLNLSFDIENNLVLTY